MNIHIWLISILLLSSCAGNNPHTSSIYEVEMVESKKYTFLKDTSIFGKAEVVFLETTKESAFKEITRMELTQDRIYIFDRFQYKMFMFDRQGQFISSLHSIGRGPKEYLQISDFTIDWEEKQVIVFSDSPGKMIFYDLDFNYIKDIPIPTSELLSEIAAGSKYIYAKASISKSNKDIAIINKNDPTKREYLLSKFKNQPNFGGLDKNLTKTKNINFTRLFDYTIYQIQEDSIKERYKFDFGVKNIPEPYKNDPSFRGEPARKIIKDNDYVYYIKNVCESDNLLIFRTNTAGICVFNKETQQTNVYTFLNNSEYGVNIDVNGIVPMNNSENKICFKLGNMPIDLYKEAVDSGKVTQVNQKLYDLSQKVNLTTNPALIIYDF